MFSNLDLLEKPFIYVSMFLKQSYIIALKTLSNNRLYKTVLIILHIAE